MAVIKLASASIILTASSLPPKPTSKTMTSKFWRAKITKEASVANSK